MLNETLVLAALRMLVQHERTYYDGDTLTTMAFHPDDRFLGASGERSCHTSNPYAPVGVSRVDNPLR